MRQIILGLERELRSFSGTKFLSLQNIDLMCAELVAKVKADKFKPDCVIGVLESGRYIGQKIAELFTSDCQYISLSNTQKSLLGVSTKESFLVRGLFKILGFKPARTGKISIDNRDYSNILLADEDVKSGETFERIKKELGKSYNLNIKTATLARTSDANYTPDYYLYEERRLNSIFGRDHCFPWREISPYYQDYKKFLKKE